MLEINVRADDQELYDDETSTFYYVTKKVQLEHSLLSVSKWESKYKKPFLSDLPDHAKTDDETFAYIRMMVLGDITEDLFERLLTYNLKEVQEYIGDAQTATTISDNKKGSRSSELVTSELIYYWMFTQTIPKECEQWHLNRLITLIRVFAAKQSKPEKQSRSEIAARNRSLNAQRRNQMKSKG